MLHWPWQARPTAGSSRAGSSCAGPPRAGPVARLGLGRIVVAERFKGPSGLRQLRLPLDSLPRAWSGMLDVLIGEDATGAIRRIVFPIDRVPQRPAYQNLVFPGFANAVAELFTIVVATDADAVPAAALLAQARALDNGRVPIELDCTPVGFAPQSAADTRLAYAFEQFWCDRSGMFLKGWIHAFDRRIERLVIRAGEHSSMVDTFTARPDVLVHYSNCPGAGQSGFQAYLRWTPGLPVLLEAQTDRGTVTEAASFPPDAGEAAEPQSPGANAAFQAMIAEVNARKLEVVEVGARKVSALWADWRTACSGASRYVGMDIHPGVGVDVVGDAHSLADLLGRESCDAVFSLSVIEHLSHPWRFAQSVAAVLRVGGLTFQGTHQTWPMHEEPNDFYRFSDEALKTLFGPENGFEVIAAGMGDKVAIYPGNIRSDHLLMPLVSAFGQSFVLSRKVRNVRPATGPTDGDAAHSAAQSAAQSAERAKTYPRRDGSPGLG